MTEGGAQYDPDYEPVRTEDGERALHHLMRLCDPAVDFEGPIRMTREEWVRIRVECIVEGLGCGRAVVYETDNPGIIGLVEHEEGRRR